MSETKSDNARQAALYYHEHPRPGKLEVRATKPLANQVDLSQAYSPGVAYPCREIQKDPLSAAEYTARSNLVGVVTNGAFLHALANHAEVRAGAVDTGLIERQLEALLPPPGPLPAEVLALVLQRPRPVLPHELVGEPVLRLAALVLLGGHRWHPSLPERLPAPELHLHKGVWACLVL